MNLSRRAQLGATGLATLSSGLIIPEAQAQTA
jgi:hypothetical protein